MIQRPIYLVHRDLWNRGRYLLTAVHQHGSQFENIDGYCLARPEWESIEKQREWIRLTGATQVDPDDMTREDAQQATQSDLWAFDMR